MNTVHPLHPRSPAWAVLETALTQRRPVRARYHGHERILCPHALGWDAGRAKVLCFQAGGTTSSGPLPTDPTRCWRILFVDEVQDPSIVDGPWRTADNYTDHQTGIDRIELAVG